jgi:Micrococcal nuclease (thermonuclease) homologs
VNRTVEILEVVDGDTVDIAFQNGSTDTVRLLGIDTPEVDTSVNPAEFEGVPNTAAGRECLSEYADQASASVTERLQDETVTLQFDSAADRRGSFGRLLGYILANGTNLNYDLVSTGLARVFDSSFGQSDRFYTAESTAQQDQTGLWECRDAGDDNTDGPADVGALSLVQIHEDAAGTERDNLDDEYLTFENQGTEPVELTGWTVTDEAGASYQFPTGFTLQPGEQVTLYTGAGTDTATSLYWGFYRPVWNNGGDTVFVTDESESLVLEQNYG